MTYESLTLEIADDVATITLNRPEKLNALSRDLQLEILEVCDRLKHDDSVRAIVWTGAGRGFCSGADVSGGPPPVQEPSWQKMMDEDSWVGRQARAVYYIDKPSVAAINGVAAGAGMSLALACDIRVGSEHARFRTVFIERALAPDAGMTYFLPRLVGCGNALDMILTSRNVGAEEALRMGLLQRLVPAESLLAEAQAVAKQIAAFPPITAMVSKRAVIRSLDNNFEDQLRYEIRAIEIARRATDDAREAIESFREKRAGRFVGH
ncbi:MAG: enoyl-CoA hydratase/isomerase family protein [Dehalococcoidia bacterium]|nr:enoyl-CoA hydratase/isomerase family protein [Dehalococcoidia bacterium]